MLAALVNGSAITDSQPALAIDDRGLSYGDGVFESMALTKGVIRFLSEHLARLQLGCERLAIPAPSPDILRRELAQLVGTHAEGIVKLVVTRGAGGRGYRPFAALSPTRIAMLFPKIHSASNQLTLRWCATRLARNPLLAGIKHLNRLEQVLAQNEWHDESIHEGLMRDTEGEMVCATAGNLFVVRDGVLATPDLRFCGIRGVMRAQVLSCARRLAIDSEERSVWPDDIEAATEVFLTNAVRGIRPVVSLEERRWDVGPITQRLTETLESQACGQK